VIERRGRLLACEFQVAGEDDVVLRALERVPFHAEQDVATTRRHRLEVAREGDGYRIREDGRPGDLLPDPEALARRVQERIHALALDALDRHPKLHAGCGTRGGCGVLFAGAGRSGKTTLMTRLLYEGFHVHGDDTVVLQDGRALAVPRPFGVRLGTLTLVPQLRPRMPAWAADGPPDGYQVLAVDPAELGFTWRIAPVRVDAVFFLEPAHGSPSRAVPCPRYRMAQRLMSQSLPPAGGARAWIREIATLVERAACHVLEIGELDSAVEQVDSVLCSLSRDPIAAPPTRRCHG
jgi:hypothetical protein